MKKTRTNLPCAFKPSEYESKGTDKYIDNHLAGIDEKFKTVKDIVAAEDAVTTDITIPSAPTGGTTVDAESRTAIGSIITALGIIETALEDIVAALVVHGILEEAE